MWSFDVIKVVLIVNNIFDFYKCNVDKSFIRMNLGGRYIDRARGTGEFGRRFKTSQ